MVNLRSTTQAYKAQGSYLTPRIGTAQTAGLAPNQLNATQADAIRQGLTVDKDHWAVQMGKYALAAPLDVVDAIAANFPGVQRGQVNAELYNAVGLPGFAAWVTNHKEGVEVGSGLLGSVAIGAAVEVAGAKLLTSGWFAATGLGRAIQPLMQFTSNAQRAASQATLEAAAAGNPLRWWQAVPGSSGLARFTTGNAGAVTAKTLEYAAKSAVSELAITAALNKNDFIWSDDMGQNALNAVLGLGIGTGLGFISSRSAVNRWANSPEVMNANAAYRDPGGLEALMNHGLPGAVDRGLPPVGVKPPQSLNAQVPKASTIVTGLMLNARRLDDSAVNVSERVANQTQWESEADKIMQTITQRGAAMIPESKFAMTSPEGLAVREALHRDPGAVFGLSAMGKVPEGMTAKEAIDSRAKMIKSALDVDNINDLNRGQIRKLEALEKETPMVLLDGEWVPHKQVANVLDFHPETAKLLPAPSGELVWRSEHIGEIRMREDGGLNRKWESLQIQDVLQVASAQHTLAKKLIGSKSTLTVPKDAHFSQIDFAVSVERMGGRVDWQSAAQLNDVARAQIESLAQKSKIIDELKEITYEDRIRLNLPKRSAAEAVSDPDGSVLRNVIRMASTPGVTLNEIKAARKEMMGVFDLLADAKVNDSLDGDIINFNRSTTKAGRQWLKPVVGYFDATPASSWSRHQLGDDVIQGKSMQLVELRAGAKDAPLVAMVTEASVRDPGFNAVMQVGKLADNMINGMTNTVKATAGQFLTQAQRFRNSPTLLAAQNIRRVANRVTELHVDEALRRVNPLVESITSTSGAQSRLLYNRYISHTKGWEIAKTQDLDNGMIGFVLDHRSAMNQERLGREITEGELLMGPEGNILGLDGPANQLRVGMEAEYDKLLKERNAVRIARGQEPVKSRPFYTPPASTKDKKFGFTLDEFGRAVPGGAIIASTQKEFDVMKAALEAKLPEGHRFLSNDMIRSHADMWERADLDFIDPTHMAAPAKQNRGALSSVTINPKGIEDSLMYLKNGYEQVSTGTIRAIFDSQLRAARVHSMARQASGGLGSQATPGLKNIFEEYEDTLLGRSIHNSDRGFAKVMHAVDERLDEGIAAAWPAVAGSTQWLGNVLDMAKVPLKGLGKGGKRPSTFAELNEAIADYMPFTKAQELADYQVREIPAWKTKEVARNLNRVASGVILRWLEIPHAVMNLAGIITAMPGLVGARNVPIIGKVAGTPVIDQTKIMARGIKRMFKREGGDWDYMVRNGDSSQDVAEIHQQMAMLDSPGAVKRFALGDQRYANWKTIKDPGERRKAWTRFKGLEGMISIVADTSEDWSRQVSHFIGLELADYHGIVGMEARHTFARKIANDTIANYDPLNKPEITQSAFGSLYGLFQSYAQNYYERLFRWTEQGEYKAIGKTMALQASMFGFMGLPGSRQLEALIGNEETGDGLVDGIYKKYGPAVGSVVAQGGFNQITTLFGILPAVSLQSRGDANFRSPTLDALTGGLKAPVGIEVLSDIVGGTWQAVASLVDPNVPNSGRHAAEILARNMPSRMLRGTISNLFLGGQEADAYGNLMSTTKSSAESMFRFLGLRSARQQGEIEAYFLNARKLEIDAAKLDGVRSASKALIRAGEFNRLPEVFEKYVAAGGQPANFQPWIRNMIRDAGNTRTENQLMKSMRNPNMQILAQRIEWMTAPY